MKRTATMALLVIAMALPTTASAGWLRTQHHTEHSWQQERFHAATTLTWLRRHPQVGTHHSRLTVRRNALWLFRLSESKIAAYHKPLSHLDGWICIHNQEGAWGANTGNGYYGGLQMSYGWAGRVTDASLLSPAQQIAAAEAEATQHGWSYTWMAGQWPNTFPPCAGYFN